MKETESIFWDSTKYRKFSSLILDYLDQKPNIRSLYHRFPTESGLIEQANEKLKSYHHRAVLCRVIENQISFLKPTEKQTENLEKLKLKNTVTVTTGHQLNLFTGPIYFFYKILQTIRCCDQMNQSQSEINFVPVFWMATEDHDFEEINHFYFQNQKFSWDRKAGGAVGRMDLNGIESVFKSFFDVLPDSNHSKELKNLIEDSYLKSKTLTEATQRLVQQLFGELGLLILDGDDKELKRLMIPAFEQELIQNTAFLKVGETNRKLSDNPYPVQVNPREINLFYLAEEPSIRERIVFENDDFRVLNSEFKFSQTEIMEELKNHPERFSPNVILRPLYQESVLPNVAYIGGSGESAYWLQLKAMFDAFSVPYPMVVVRNSFLILSQKQHKALNKLSIDFEELMLPLNEIIHQNIMQHAEIEIDFEKYRKLISDMFEGLKEKAVQTDASFSKMVDAQQAKQMKGLEKMMKRLIKAEKRKQSERVERIETIYKQIFPQNNLQERVLNFSEIQLEYGWGFINEVLNEIKPIDFCFTIKTFDD